MNDHWLFQLLCQLQLSQKPFFLKVMAFLIPIVVKPDLSYRHDFRFLKLFPHPLHILFPKFTHFVRMYANGTVYKLILFT